MQPRNLFLIPFLLLHSCLSAQIHTSLLKVAVIDCRSGETDWSQQIKLYKLPENILYQNIRPYKYKEGRIEIPYFIAGTYRVEYRNVFGEEIAKVYQLDDCDSNEVTICVNEFEQPRENILKKLNDGDSVIIDFYTHGCFHASTEKMVITKMNKHFEATIYPPKTLFTPYGVEEKSTRIEKIVLSEKNLNDFALFENGLNRIKKNGGCTTVDSYTTITKWGIKRIEDAGCQWRGYWHLRKSFIGNK